MTEWPEKWRYGVASGYQPWLQSLLDALRKLCNCGITTVGVVAAFHKQRVLPLMARRLRLDQMTPRAPMEGVRMSDATLTVDDVMRRVRDTVGEGFIVADLYKVKMRPSQGYISLVSRTVFPPFLYFPHVLSLLLRHLLLSVSRG